MSKKKNTLKDLDEFLKQQAATLVSPTRLSEKAEAAEPVAPAATAPPEEKPATTPKTSLEKTISTTSLVKDLKQLALTKGSTINEEMSSLILAATENQSEFSPEDKMLINTALYLKHGPDWKDAIRQYWKSKKS
jgi:hypothetical protein